MTRIKKASICVGAHMFSIDFVVVDTLSNYFAGAVINCKEETIILKFGEVKIKFHISKFQDKPMCEELKEPCTLVHQLMN
jgi:hypothetical protein